MNVSYRPKDRRVIPNWRYFAQTSSIGELDDCLVASEESTDEEEYAIDGYVTRWLDRKNLFNAGDLISAAVSNSRKYHPQSIEAARFVLSHECQDNIALHNTAKFVVDSLREESVQKMETRLNDALNQLDTIQNVAVRIRTNRALLRDYPYNPILYVDMARSYLTIGRLDKSLKMMRIALSLGKENRYIARAAARLYIHIGDLERAHYVLRQTGAVRYDPWILASEISICMLMDKNSSHVKRGLELVCSRNFTPFSITELSSSLGTLEMQYSRKKSRDLFQLSLADPNENSLAQADWASRYIPIRLSHVDRESVRFDYEAQAYTALEQGDFQTAVTRIVDWVCDMPFSRKPVLLGAHIAYTYLNDYVLSEKLLRVGVKANPQDCVLLNDLAYVLARQNKTADAIDYMEKLEAQLKRRLANQDLRDEYSSIEVCMTATQGLIAFRQGNHLSGKEKYEEAIRMAEKNKSKDKSTYCRAILNYNRERQIASPYRLKDVKDLMMSMELPSDDHSLEILRQEVLNIYESKPSSLDE